MNGRSGTLSPVSVAGSEWSGISRYQSINAAESVYSPSIPSTRGTLATPPISGSLSTMDGGLLSGMNRRPSDSPGNPSPPSSVARSSNAMSLSDLQTKKALMMEEALSEHYMVLKRYLAPSLRDDKGNPKVPRARDKLLRLSAVQFQELSTDVYDELMRRQRSARQSKPGAGTTPNDVSDFLPPKENFHPKRNQARRKLSTLPEPRFRDLATDVFYELERRFPRFQGGSIERMGSPASMKGPPSRSGTPTGMRPGSRAQVPPPRGPGRPPQAFQARDGSLGGLPPVGLGVPGVTGLEAGFGRPQPKSFQSNTIVPNKSTLVEDDDDQSGLDEDDDSRSDAFGLEGAGPGVGSRRDTDMTSRSLGVSERDKKTISDYQAQIGQLQGNLEELESQLRRKDAELSKYQEGEKDRGSPSDSERREWLNLRTNFESKLDDALSLNSSLHLELNKVRSDHSRTERDLRTLTDKASKRGSAGGDWKTRCESLERDNEALKTELREQQQVTNEVRREASAFLKEMKALSDRSSQSWEREEQLVHQVHRLEEEVKDWKARYARTKTQLRTLRASSTSVSILQPDAGQYAKDGGLTSLDGLVKDVHVTKFQIAIDELLRTARVKEPASVLDHMKAVVISVRHVTQDMGDLTSNEDGMAQRRQALKTRVSATANNLITASKNFAASNGLSPVSLLDAAASHLTSAVVELIRLVKIRPTPADELEEDDDEGPRAESSGYFSMRLGRDSGGESIYSTMTSPRVSSMRAKSLGSKSWAERQSTSTNGLANGNGLGLSMKMGFGLRKQDTEIEELKFYLDSQTEGLVHSIQSLVGSVRAEDGASVIRDHTSDIATLVGKVLSSTDAAIHKTGNVSLRAGAEPIMRTLSDCRSRLLGANAESAIIHDTGTLKDFNNRLPPIAFEIARETKELVHRVAQIYHEAADDDDFR